MRALVSLAADPDSAPLFPGAMGRAGTKPRKSRKSTKSSVGGKARPQFPIVGLPGVDMGLIQQSFDEIDFDGNHHIDVSELRYLLTLLGETPEDEELEDMIAMIADEGNEQANFEDFLSLFADKAVVAQMMTYKPHEEDPTLDQVRRKELAREEREKADGEKDAEQKKREVDLLLKAAAGFLHGASMEKKKKGTQVSSLPQPKAPWAGARRARPDPPMEALPLSPRSAMKTQKDLQAALGMPGMPPGVPGMPGMPGQMPGQPGMPGQMPVYGAAS